MNYPSPDSPIIIDFTASTEEKGSGGDKSRKV